MLGNLLGGLGLAEKTVEDRIREAGHSGHRRLHGNPVFRVTCGLGSQRVPGANFSLNPPPRAPAAASVRRASFGTRTRPPG